MRTFTKLASTILVLASSLALYGGAQPSTSGSGAKRGVVKILAEGLHGETETGAGILLSVNDDLALILTAHHVVENAKRIEVVFYDLPYVKFLGRRHDKYQEDLDLAVVIVDSQGGRELPKDLSGFTLGDTKKLKEQDKISTIGHPLELDWHAATHTIDKLSDLDDFRKLRITDGSIQRGSSGGPILNEQGALIGLVTKRHKLYAVGVKIDRAIEVLDDWRIPSAKLVSPPTFGALVVGSEPAGVRVFLGGTEQGSTGEDPLRIEDLEAGRHTLRLVKEGYKAWETTVEVKAGQEQAISAKLDPVPVSPAEPEPKLAPPPTVPPQVRVGENWLRGRYDAALEDFRHILETSSDPQARRRADERLTWLEPHAGRLLFADDFEADTVGEGGRWRFEPSPDPNDSDSGFRLYREDEWNSLLHGWGHCHAFALIDTRQIPTEEFVVQVLFNIPDQGSAYINTSLEHSRFGIKLAREGREGLISLWQREHELARFEGPGWHFLLLAARGRHVKIILDDKQVFDGETPGSRPLLRDFNLETLWGEMLFDQVLIARF